MAVRTRSQNGIVKPRVARYSPEPPPARPRHRSPAREYATATTTKSSSKKPSPKKPAAKKSTKKAPPKKSTATAANAKAKVAPKKAEPKKVAAPKREATASTAVARSEKLASKTTEPRNPPAAKRKATASAARAAPKKAKRNPPSDEVQAPAPTKKEPHTTTANPDILLPSLINFQPFSSIGPPPALAGSPASRPGFHHPNPNPLLGSFNTAQQIPNQMPQQLQRPPASGSIFDPRWNFPSSSSGSSYRESSGGSSGKLNRRGQGSS